MEAFGNHEVVPDVIDQAPQQLLEVTWPHGSANLGNVLTPTQMKTPPNVKWNADPNSYYTLIMTDPDAPSRRDPKNREWKHWLVVNIPGSNVSEGEVINGYVGGGPPFGTGLHRYVFLVYKQDGKKTFDLPHIPSESTLHRAKFHTRTFLKKFDLHELVAANFVQAEWDEWVPHLYKTFTN